MIIRLLCVFFVVCNLIVPEPSFAIDSGEQAPEFALSRYDGKLVKLSDYAGKPVILEWFNAGCPFSMKHYNSGNMQALQNEFTKRGAVWLTINSTNQAHKDYLTPEKAAQFIKDHEATSALFLADPDGKVGKLYGAKTTPHIFIISANGTLVYQGAIDDDSDLSSDAFKSKNYVREVLDALLAGKNPTITKTASYGCGVKYAG